LKAKEDLPVIRVKTTRAAHGASKLFSKITQKRFFYVKKK